MQSHYFPYLGQFLIALGLTSLTVVSHYFGMKKAQCYFRWFLAENRHYKHESILMIGIVAILISTHFIEVVIWALLYYLIGFTPDWLHSVYYSLVNYTTIGDSNIAVPDHWKGLAGLEAINAILMFGWSTAVLATVSLKLLIDEKI